MEYALFALLALYLAPALVAAGREHPQQGGIMLVNVLLGWTGLGWLAALLWAAPALRPRRRRAGPVLRIVRDPVMIVPWSSRLERMRGSIAPPLWVPISAAGLATAIALGSGDTLRRTPIEAPYRAEVVRLASTALHARPGRAAPVVGELGASCVVKVLEQSGRWQYVWKTAQCSGLSSGRSRGWIRASASLPRR